MQFERDEGRSRHPGRSRRTHLRRTLVQILVFGTGCTVCLLLQSLAIMQCKAVASLVQAYNYYSLLVIFVFFMVFLSFCFFYEKLMAARSWVRWLFVLVLVELGSVNLLLSAVSVNWVDVLNASLLMAVLLALCTLFALHQRIALQHERKFLLLCTGRYFLISSMGALISNAVHNVKVCIVIDMSVVGFLSLFVLVFSNSIGAPEIYEGEETSSVLLYAVLAYCNLAGVFSHAIALLESVRLLPVQEAAEEAAAAVSARFGQSMLR